MRFRTVAKQWAFIANEFEQAVTEEHRVVKELKDQDDATDHAYRTYCTGRLNALELGLAQAKDRHRALRFSFWKTQVVTDNLLLMSFLTELHIQIDRMGLKKTEFLLGMHSALFEWNERTGYLVFEELKKGRGL